MARKEIYKTITIQLTREEYDFIENLQESIGLSAFNRTLMYCTEHYENLKNEIISLKRAKSNLERKVNDLEQYKRTVKETVKANKAFMEKFLNQLDDAK